MQLKQKLRVTYSFECLFWKRRNLKYNELKKMEKNKGINTKKKKR